MSEDKAAAAGMTHGSLLERMGIEVTEYSVERVVGTMPVEGNTQPYGLLHGGASLVLAESLGSYGSALIAAPDRIAVGIEISATHHHAAVTGTVTGVATPIHAGRTLSTWGVEVHDSGGRLICTARITCLLRDRTPGSRRTTEG